MHIMTVARHLAQPSLDSRGLAGLPIGSVVVVGREDRRETVIITRHWALRARLALFELTGWHLVSARSAPIAPRRVPGVPRPRPGLW